MCFPAGTVLAQLKPRITHYTTKDGLPHNSVLSLKKDKQGFMWFGTWDGICRYDGHDFVTYRAKVDDQSSSKINRIDKIVGDKQDYLWLKAKDRTVYRFDKQTAHFLPVAKNMSNGERVEYLNIVPSRVSGVWLFTKDHGVTYIAENTSSKLVYHNYRAESKKDASIQSNIVNFFQEDANSKVWIGTNKGLTVLAKTGNSNKPYLASHLFSGRGIKSTTQDSAFIWFGTEDGRLIKYQKRTGKFLYKTLSEYSINGLLASSNRKELYATTSEGLILILDKSMNVISKHTISSNRPLLSIYEDKWGNLWLEPDKEGVVRFHKLDKTFRVFSRKRNESVNNSKDYFKVFEDQNGFVWACMKGGGLAYYDNTSNEMMPFTFDSKEDDSDFMNTINGVFYDSNGVLWLGEEAKGLHKITFQRNDFPLKKIVLDGHSKAENETRAILSDKLGRLWVATKSRKLYCYQDNKKLVLPFDNYPKNDLGRIYCILEDSKGNLWFGTREDGLFKAEPKDDRGTAYTLTHYVHDERNPFSLSSNVIYDILEDNRGRIWVATGSNGINMIATQNQNTVFLNRFNSFKNYPKKLFFFIRNLEQDKDGNIWAATSDGLLILNAPGDNPNLYKVSTYRYGESNPASLGNNDLQDIYRDSAGRMWLATLGGGLNLAYQSKSVHNLKFKRFTVSDGIASNYILSINGDTKTGLWLTTQNGITNINPDKYSLRNFDGEDGLSVQQFSEGSTAKLPSGEIIFGAVDGIVQFNPGMVRTLPTKGKLVFTKLQINNKDVSYFNKREMSNQHIIYATPITLKYDQNIFSISFTTLDFKTEKKLQYYYRLKGFEADWKDNHYLRQVSYTNLAPGKYVFEVKSPNPDLYSNLPYRYVEIEILPPFWKTWWAYLFYLIVAGMLFHIIRSTALTMLRLRNKIVIEQQVADLRQEFFTNISHELRTPLTLILNPVEEILKKETLSNQGREFLLLARKNSERMLKFVNQFLDLRKVENNRLELSISKVEIVSFVKQATGFFSGEAMRKNISINISSTVDTLYAWIDIDKIDMVLNNLLSNAFKFSPDNSNLYITIDFQPENNYFTITVADQGEGVAETELDRIFQLYYQTNLQSQLPSGTGIGLAFSKALIELHGGKIWATNNLDKGLTITIQLLCGNAHIISEVADQKVKKAVIQNFQYPDCDNHKTVQILDENKPLILLVEDNDDLRNFMKIQLSEHYQVRVAQNGEEGLKSAIEIQPELILSDVMMPVMNGLDMLISLKSNAITSHVPVILLSAKQSIESQIAGLEFGADLYIAKPFNNDLLMASIRGLIRRRAKAFENIVSGKKNLLHYPTEVVITTHDELFLKKVVAIVSEKMADENFNIDLVAETIGISRSAFFKKFKALTDVAPVEFVKDMRIKRAKEYLDAGENNISGIAYAVGFNDGKYFSRCFKDKFGMSPSAYLKKKLES